MKIDPRRELAQIARRGKAKVRELDLIYPGVPGAFDQVCRFKRGDHKVSWATNGRVFLIQTEVSSAIVFAAGRPDDFILLASEPREAVEGVPVFSPTEVRSPKEWFSKSNRRMLLASIGVEPEEQLLVAQDRVSLIATPRGAVEDWDRLGRLLRFVEELPMEREELCFEPSELPVPLRAVARFVEPWAIGDDQKRMDRINEAASEDLAELVAEVGPLLRDINDRLDKAGRAPLSDSDVLLGSLAEAAVEAQLELDRRP